MNDKYTYLAGIREAIEQRLGHALSDLEFQILLIRGNGQFWDLHWGADGIRLYDLKTVPLPARRRI
jgi:hypothetical protein